MGWSLFQVARGVADLVNGLLTKYPSGAELNIVARFQPATWIVGDRLLTFTTLIEGTIELAVVLLVVLLIVRRPRAAQNGASLARHSGGGSPSQ